MSEPALPRLLVTPSDAKAKIKEQIKQGEAIQELSRLVPFGHLDSFGQLPQAKTDAEKWAKYTIDLLKSLFSDTSIANEFGDWYYHAPTFGLPVENFNRWMQGRITRLESIEERLELFPTVGSEAKGSGNSPTPSSRDIFLVHGHDAGAKEEVARFLEKLELRPIILHEQPDQGRTIIEKFEDHSNVGFAVVLLTPDDEGYPKNQPSKKQDRARQNVVLELGFFLSKLGRTNVSALLKDKVELPTDYSGVLYITMDPHGAWHLKLAKEIKSAGIDINLNKAL
jgi:predicted nucleotide-binding protein